jgi:hypothetical protein
MAAIPRLVPWAIKAASKARIETLGARLVSAERPEGSREVRLGIDLAEQVLDAHARKAGLDETAQGFQFHGYRQSIPGRPTLAT